MTGWVRVSRSIFEHELFANEPMSEREAWLWLVAKAAWKDTRHRIGGEVVDVPRGSLFVTLRELQTAWRWKSDTRVRSFLARLEKERMISRESNAGKTHVSICNYTKYQDTERTENTPETHEKRTENALKEQDNKITKDTATPTSALGHLESQLREAAKAEQNPSPSLFDLSPIRRCLTDGASLEMDVIPTIRAITARNHYWQSWKYAEKAIMDAKASREAPAVEGQFQKARAGPGQDRPLRGSAAMIAALQKMREAHVSQD